MPTLACWTCGRRIYMSDPLDDLLPDERRCPRCGAAMDPERRDPDMRDHDRRQTTRRKNAPDRPGPPGRSERRSSERRSGRDRRTRR